MMKFNERLLDLRKKNGWSQEELGYKLDVSRQTISKWESGQTTPELEKLRNLAKIFEISVDELISEEDVLKEESINTEKENKKSSSKKCSKVFKYIKVILSLIIFSIFVIYVIIVCRRIVIIRNVEKILMDTMHQYKYMDIQQYEYSEMDEVFPSKDITKTFQIYEKDNKVLVKSKIRDAFSEKPESVEYYEEYNKEKDKWEGVKIDYNNKVYYLDLFKQPFEHNYAVYYIKIFEEYQKNYNPHIERLDIKDLIMALNLKIRIAKVDNILTQGYVITNKERMYQDYCEILIDTTAETICLEKIIYNEKTKDYKSIERYRYTYADNYVLLEEIQVPDLSEYTLVEYVEE